MQIMHLLSRPELFSLTDPPQPDRIPLLASLVPPVLHAVQEIWPDSDSAPKFVPRSLSTLAELVVILKVRGQGSGVRGLLPSLGQ